MRKFSRLGWVWLVYERLFLVLFGVETHPMWAVPFPKHFEQCKRRKLAEDKQLCIHSFFVLDYGGDAFSSHHNFCVIKRLPWNCKANKCLLSNIFFFNQDMFHGDKTETRIP